MKYYGGVEGEIDVFNLSNLTRNIFLSKERLLNHMGTELIRSFPDKRIISGSNSQISRDVFSGIVMCISLILKTKFPCFSKMYLLMKERKQREEIL